MRHLFGEVAPPHDGGLEGLLARLFPADADGLRRDLAFVLRTGSSRMREVRLAREDGSARVLQCLLTSAEGSDETLIGMLSDVTDLAAMRDKDSASQKHEALGRSRAASRTTSTTCSPSSAAAWTRSKRRSRRSTRAPKTFATFATRPRGRRILYDRC